MGRRSSIDYGIAYRFDFLLLASMLSASMLISRALELDLSSSRPPQRSIYPFLTMDQGRSSAWCIAYRFDSLLLLVSMLRASIICRALEPNLASSRPPQRYISFWVA